LHNATPLPSPSPPQRAAPPLPSLPGDRQPHFYLCSPPLRSGVSARGQAGSNGAAAVASNEVLLLLQLHGSTVKHIPHDVKAMLNTGRFEGQQVSYKNKRSKLVTGLQQLLVGMISVQTRHRIICLSALPSSCFFHYQGRT
ncbi:unnamed protein product, partial [Urochloa humidicola]